MGNHLGTQQLADQFGVSRSPIREALQLLADQKILQRQANRGFFVRSMRPSPGKPVGGNPERPERSSAYRRLAEDWLDNHIGDEITEQFLRNRYRLTKAQVTDLLMRAVREGWVERKPGYGWRLLPVAKTQEAFEQIYRFRMLIEPAALLEPSFRIDRAALAEQRRIQEEMLTSGAAAMPADRIVLNGSMFHEEIIRMAGNPFFVRALEQANRMRRLLEYRAKVDRQRLRSQCTEHLQIIALLEKGDVIEASYLMRQHLSGALARKAPQIHGAGAGRGN
ncbi:MAG: GntR family transcriptional regulator [Steroidobacteraceae bacterium]